MANQSTHLSAIFAALADPTRRAVLARLTKGPATVTQLAAPFDIALPSVMKHLRLLEDSGCIRTQKTGCVRTCILDTKPFTTLEGWIAQQRTMMASRTAHADRIAMRTRA